MGRCYEVREADERTNRENQRTFLSYRLDDSFGRGAAFTLHERNGLNEAVAVAAKIYGNGSSWLEIRPMLLTKAAIGHHQRMNGR